MQCGRGRKARGDAGLGQGARRAEDRLGWMAMKNEGAGRPRKRIYRMLLWYRGAAFVPSLLVILKSNDTFYNALSGRPELTFGNICLLFIGVLLLLLAAETCFSAIVLRAESVELRSLAGPKRLPFEAIRGRRGDLAGWTPSANGNVVLEPITDAHRPINFNTAHYDIDREFMDWFLNLPNLDKLEGAVSAAAPAETSATPE